MSFRTKEKKAKNGGITLIALVITIIVLLILVGVTIATLMGDNGILNKATKADISTENATVLEQLQLKVMDYKIELESTNAYEEILSLLKQDGYVNEDNTVNVVNLVDEVLYAGKGSIENGDIYVLEQREIIATTVETDQTSNLPYYLIYYNTNKEDIVLGKLFESIDAVGLEFLEITKEGEVSLKEEYSYYGTGNETGNIDLITEIRIPEYIDGIRVTKIADNAFSRCKNLETVVLPDSITEIGWGAFYECTKLTNIKIPDNVTAIEQKTFSYCENLTEVVLSENITTIGHIAFTNCSQLTEIELPSNLKNIGSSAFSYCENLSQIEIPQNVTSIGYAAFRNCYNIKHILIPLNVTELDNNVFENWKSDQTIYIEYKKSEIPNGWSQSWNTNCRAQIRYGFDKNYFYFAQEYLLDKNQEELEELILKTAGYSGTFDQLLTEAGMTRDEWEQQGTDKGMTYMEYLKDLLIYGDNGFSWVQVEFEVSKQGGTGKTVEELETLYAQKYGAESFDELLAKENMTKEQFIEKLKKQGFRTEEDFLKVYVYFVPDV